MNIDIEIIKLQSSIDEVVTDKKDDMLREFKPAHGATNEEAAKDYEIFNQSLALKINQTMNTISKKQMDNAKKKLDSLTFGDPSAGEELTLASNNGVLFKKKRNNDTTSCSSKDLIIELEKLGVDQDMLRAAIDNATKPKRGNLYYIVEGE